MNSLTSQTLNEYAYSEIKNDLHCIALIIFIGNIPIRKQLPQALYKFNEETLQNQYKIFNSDYVHYL